MKSYWEDGVVGGHWVVEWEHEDIMARLAFADAASQEYADRKAALAADVQAGWDGTFEVHNYYFDYGGKTAEELYGPVYSQPEMVSPEPVVESIKSQLVGGGQVGDVVEVAGVPMTVIAVDAYPWAW